MLPARRKLTPLSPTLPRPPQKGPLHRPCAPLLIASASIRWAKVLAPQDPGGILPGMLSAISPVSGSSTPAPSGPKARTSLIRPRHRLPPRNITASAQLCGTPGGPVRRPWRGPEPELLCCAAGALGCVGRVRGHGTGRAGTVGVEDAGVVVGLCVGLGLEVAWDRRLLGVGMMMAGLSGVVALGTGLCGRVGWVPRSVTARPAVMAVSGG